MKGRKATKQNPGRKALGRGLSALIPDAPKTAPADSPLRDIDLELISPNPDQPRKRFEPEALKELAQSIEQQGVISPVVVRQKGERFELIAGERRWRAAQLAGLHRIPALVKNLKRAQALEVALVENIQRAQLNPIEEARAFRALIDEFTLKQEEVARRVGRDRSTVANSLRLLNLEAGLQEQVARGDLSAGHARAVLSVDDEAGRRELAGRVVKEGMSVRQAERWASRRRKEKAVAGKDAPATADVFLRSAAERLQRSLGTRVAIRREGSGGRIELHFHSDEELSRLADLLLSAGRSR